MVYLNRVKTKIGKLIAEIRKRGSGDTAVGLDVGKHSIKLVQLRYEHGNIVLDRIDSAEITPLSENSSEDNQKVKKAIAGLFARNGIKSKKIIFGINGQSAFIKFLEVLPVKAENLAKTLKYEAQQQIPFSLDEVEWDSHLFGSLQEKEISAYRVLLTAIKKDRLAAQEGLLEGIGLRPSILDISSLSIYNCIRFNRDYEEGKLSVVLNIGAQSADLLILKGESLWIRSIAIGGDNITAALVKEFNINPAEAEELKQKNSRFDVCCFSLSIKLVVYTLIIQPAFCSMRSVLWLLFPLF